MSRPLVLSLCSAPLLAGLLIRPVTADPTDLDPATEPAATSARAADRSPEPASAAASVRLRLSGHLEGRLEPCGCASGQVGGLARRALRNQQDRTYDFLIEGGEMLVDGGPLDELKLFTTLNVLDDRRARYDAIGIGGRDLELEFELLDTFAQSFPELTFVASDLIATGDRKPGGLRAAAQLEKDGRRVVVASLAGALPAAGDESAKPYGIERLPAAAAWQRALDGVAAETLRVLLVHGGSEAARSAAESLEPSPDLIVAIHAEHPEPPREPEIAAGVPIVHPGIRGRFLVDVTLERTAEGPRVTGYEAFPLTGKGKPDAMADKATAELILAHRFEVAEDGTLESMAERFPTENGASYVGSATCAGCHTEAFQAWQGSKHAGAWETLEKAAEERYGWPVTKYPDCVACHSVGYSRKSGYVNPERTPHLGGVGCESCHGAGSAHIANPTEVKLGDVAESTCRSCHDFEQSPKWNYGERWKLIEHK